jgi:hypothetical protein
VYHGADTLCFTFSVKPKSTWTLLKPHFENLVSSFIFPHLCFSASKQELWNADPADYIRTSVGTPSHGILLKAWAI